MAAILAFVEGGALGAPAGSLSAGAHAPDGGAASLG